jgi:DNA-binding NarL/FixJ family response regulator
MFRESLIDILSIKNIAKVIGEASNGLELVALLEKLKPNIILMDVAMPEMDGIEATKKALEKYPDSKVIALSSFGDEKYYYSMLEAGAKGFVIKNAGIVELQNAIVEVAKGGNWFSSELIQKIVIKLNDKYINKPQQLLTGREIEIITCICECYTNEQISEKLNISQDTVKWHRANILIKTEASNTAGLVIYAIKNKIFIV